MKITSDIYINGKRLRINASSAIGKGGEADVYDIGHGQALKLYKPPDHPDFQLEPVAREAARQRIAEQQQKLPQFPGNLPAKVVAPVLPATADARGQHIVGYTMPYLQGADVLLRFGDRAFRESSGINHDQVMGIFKDLHATVTQVHQTGVVIGDFNDLNVLTQPTGDAFLIDADSFQFGPFLCRTFTTRFVDPTLCDPANTSLVLSKPHTSTSDWYAFCVMLMQCLLYVDPYGGLYRPKDPAQRLGHNLRPLQRITVFHPEVRYPKPAIPYGVLPDELLQLFHRVFEKDQREPFPRPLLESLRWTTCKACSVEHARLRCPRCCHTGPAAIKETVVMRGEVTATRIFQTSGIILCAAYQHCRLRYLFHENSHFKREDGSIVANGDLDAKTRFNIHGDATLIGRDGQVIVLRRDGAERISVDSYGVLPVFDANENHIYWLQAGQLRRNGQLGPEYIGDVLTGQTRFWSGPTFGFGFYRAGNLSVAFVFDAGKGGINDVVQLPPMHGQVYDATCVFTTNRCWFFVAVQEGGRLIHRCFIIRPDGSLEATAEADANDGSWLGSNLHGKCGAGTFLLAPTEDGIVRVEVVGDTVVTTKTFPDTEPFVHAASALFPGHDGVYVVGQQDIQVLKIR